VNGRKRVTDSTPNDARMRKLREGSDGGRLCNRNRAGGTGMNPTMRENKRKREGRGNLGRHRKKARTSHVQGRRARRALRPALASRKNGNDLVKRKGCHKYLSNRQ